MLLVHSCCSDVYIRDPRPGTRKINVGSTGSHGDLRGFSRLLLVHTSCSKVHTRWNLWTLGFYRKVAFGLGPDEKIPSDPLTWATSQITDKIPECNEMGIDEATMKHKLKFRESMPEYTYKESDMDDEQYHRPYNMITVKKSEKYGISPTMSIQIQQISFFKDIFNLLSYLYLNYLSSTEILMYYSKLLMLILQSL